MINFYIKVMDIIIIIKEVKNYLLNKLFYFIKFLKFYVLFIEIILLLNYFYY